MMFFREMLVDYLMVSVFFKRFVATVGILLLVACSTVPEVSEQWSPSWPPESAFVQAYQADSDNQASQSVEDYMRWIRRFYEGWTFYPDGWDWITDAVLQNIDSEAERVALKEQIYSIGLRISREWAKDSDYRVINTRHLLVWGESLKLSVAQSQEARLAAKVSMDIDLLMARELDPSVIKMSRYRSGPSQGVDDGDEEDEFDL